MPSETSWGISATASKICSKLGFFINESAKIDEQLTKKFEHDHVLCVLMVHMGSVEEQLFLHPRQFKFAVTRAPY